MTLAESRPWMIGAVIGLGGVLIAGLAWVNMRQEAARRATRPPEIAGAPCPQVSAAEFKAGGLKAPRRFAYGGSKAGGLEFGVTRFGRFAGHVACDQFQKGLWTVVVCQFTSPAALSVSTARGEVFYVPGVGRPATVMVERDVPRCVMASNFTL